MKRFHFSAELLGAACALPSIASACSSCGCTLNSDWASQGYTVTSGLNIDLRYDYFNQDDLRSGTDSVNRSSLEIPNEREIQNTTVNRNTTLGIDYSGSRMGRQRAAPVLRSLPQHDCRG